MRSAWLKWARAVEHQRVLARASREFSAADSYEYVRTDNMSDPDDPLVRLHWRLKVKQPYPDRWGVILGDILTNFRAALDHAFWDAVMAHSGPPAKPNLVYFPITTSSKSFQRSTRDLAALVAADVWQFIEATQPFHGGAVAHTAPLEILRWLSNVDKHRTIHIVGRIAVDMQLPVESSVPLEVVEDWRLDGPADDGAVIARLKFKRSTTTQPIDVRPTFAHIASIQISDNPVEFRPLSSAMDKIREKVLETLFVMSTLLGASVPELDDLELGEEHDAYASEYGGSSVTIRKLDGSTERTPLHADDDHMA